MLTPRSRTSERAACSARGFGDDRTPLLLFGAGHVGRAVVLALAPLPFRVRWIDPRAEAFPSHLPANVEAVLSPDPAAEIAAGPAGGFVLVMTHSHPLDLAITMAALSRGDLGFVGLIGSRSKKGRFISRMRAAGLSEPQIEGLTCPIGVSRARGQGARRDRCVGCGPALAGEGTVNERASGGLPGPAMGSPMRGIFDLQEHPHEHRRSRPRFPQARRGPVLRTHALGRGEALRLGPGARRQADRRGLEQHLLDQRPDGACRDHGRAPRLQGAELSRSLRRDPLRLGRALPDVPRRDVFRQGLALPLRHHQGGGDARSAT